MDILLFTQNVRKAEYVSLKLRALGHSICVAQTLAAVHHTLRHSDPDFVIADSETFPEPHNDYRKIIQLCRRRFLLYYDNELLDKENGHPNLNRPGTHLSAGQSRCLSDITQAFMDIHVLRTLESVTFSQNTAERQRFLKQHRLRLPHAQLLACMLKNKGADITASTLINMLWADDDIGHRQTLYAYINQLRGLLESRNIPLIIERRMKGAYRISIKKSCPDNEAASS